MAHALVVENSQRALVLVSKELTDRRHSLHDLLREEAVVHAQVVRLDGAEDGRPHRVREVVEHYTCERAEARHVQVCCLTSCES